MLTPTIQVRCATTDGADMLPRQAIGPARQFPAWLARPSMALRFFSMVLAAIFVAPEAAHSQTIGPGQTSPLIVGGNSSYIYNPDTGPITLSTTAPNAIGIIIRGNGDLTIRPPGFTSGFGTFITTTGDGAHAISDEAAGHPVKLNSVSITTSGANAHGINLLNPGVEVEGTNVAVTTAGTGASAISMDGGGNPSVAVFTNSTLQSSGGPVINVIAGVENIVLTDTIVRSLGGDGQWLNVTSGTATINASQATLTGAVVTAGVATSNLTLTNGTAWDMTGSSNVTNLTNNASQIDFAAGGAFKTLTTVNYVGVGGTIGLNTHLGADGSPSDLLIINTGTATGSTLLHITNAGGQGAETTGNGILVVNAINGGTTTPGAFALAGEVRGGAFDYYLFRGGALPGTNPNDWFLRSDFTVGGGGDPGGGGGAGDPGGTGGGGGAGGTVLPVDSPASVLPPGIYPIIGPEIATYAAVQPIARQLGLTSLGTHDDRIGTHDDRTGDQLPCQRSESADKPIYTKAPPSTECVPAQRPAVWGRAFGQQIDNRYHAFADSRTTGAMAGFQAGFDLLRSDFIPGHIDSAGLYVAYGNGNIDVSGLVTNAEATAYVLRHTGRLMLDAWSGGVYWSHVGPGGWYLDTVLQGTRYTGSATTQFASLDTTGTGFISSLEGGVPIALPRLGPGFVLEPQAQVLWQQVSFHEANDAFGAVVLGTTSGAAGRIGLKGKGKCYVLLR